MLLLFLKVIFCCVSFEIVVILKTGSYHQFEIEKFGVSRFQINFQISQNNSKDFKWACEAAHFWQRVSEITQKWYWFALAYFNLSEILFNFLASLGKSFYIKLCSFYHFVVVFTFCCIFTFFCTFTSFRGLIVNIFISLDGKILFLNFSRVTLFCEKHWAYISVRSFFTSRQGQCKQSNGWSTFFWKCLCF